MFSLNLFSDYTLKPTNLKISGDLDPTFYFSGKLSIFRYLLPYRNYSPPNVIFLTPRVVLIFHKNCLDLHSLNLKLFRKILIFPIKVLCWKKLSKKPIFNKRSGSPKFEFQRFWRQTKVPLPLFSFASNPSPMADLTVSSFRFSPNFTTKPVQSQNVSTSTKIRHQPTPFDQVFLRVQSTISLFPDRFPSNSTSTLPFANQFWKCPWFRYRYVQSPTSLFPDRFSSNSTATLPFCKLILKIYLIQVQV